MPGMSFLPHKRSAALLWAVVLGLTWSLWHSEPALGQDNSSIEHKIKSYIDNGIYGPSESKVAYILKLRNNINDNQKGNIFLDVRNDLLQVVHHEEIPLFIKPGGTYYKDINIDIAKLPTGFYTIGFNIVTNHYSKFFYYMFGVEPEKMKPTGVMPNDFTQFWDNARNELANTNPAYKIIRRGDLTTPKNEVYLIEYQSIGNTTIRGWLSVPKARKKNAVLIRFPDYVNASAPESRNDMAVLTLDARGVGISADQRKLDHNTFLLDGIASPATYVFRGLYMDCLRSLDFVLRYEDLRLDPEKIVLVGCGQGACVAAAVAGMDKRAKGLVVELPTLMDLRTSFAVGEIKPMIPWPIQSVKGYCNYAKMPLDNFFRTWDYFDPMNFAPMIHCPTLVGISLKSNISPPQCAYGFYNQVLSQKRETYTCPDNETGIDESFYTFENNWIKEVLRL